MGKKALLKSCQGRMLLEPAQWNQMLCLNRITLALPVPQLLKTHSYQSAAIPPGRAGFRVIGIRCALTGSDKTV
jgi:hypothetical protein